MEERGDEPIKHYEDRFIGTLATSMFPFPGKNTDKPTPGKNTDKPQWINHKQTSGMPQPVLPGQNEQEQPSANRPPSTVDKGTSLQASADAHTEIQRQYEAEHEKMMASITRTIVTNPIALRWFRHYCTACAIITCCNVDFGFMRIDPARPNNVLATGCLSIGEFLCEYEMVKIINTIHWALHQAKRYNSIATSGLVKKTHSQRISWALPEQLKESMQNESLVQNKFLNGICESLLRRYENTNDLCEVLRLEAAANLYCVMADIEKLPLHKAKSLENHLNEITRELTTNVGAGCGRWNWDSEKPPMLAETYPQRYGGHDLAGTQYELPTEYQKVKTHSDQIVTTLPISTRESLDYPSNLF